MSETSSETEPPSSGPPGYGLTFPSRELARLAREVIDRGGIFQLQAVGTSMMPMIRDGDDIFIGRPGTGGPQIGEILFTETASEVVRIHRLIRKTRTRSDQGRAHSAGAAYITKGDNSVGSDEPVPAAGVIGRMVGLEREGHRQQYSRLDIRLAMRILGHLEAWAEPIAASQAPGRGSLIARGCRSLLFLKLRFVRAYLMRSGWSRI